MPFNPHTPRDIADMLAAIDVGREENGYNKLSKQFTHFIYDERRKKVTQDGKRVYVPADFTSYADFQARIRDRAKRVKNPPSDFAAGMDFVQEAYQLDRIMPK